MKRCFLVTTIRLGTLFQCMAGLHGVNRVFVKSEAQDEYLIERARDASKKMQSYQFMKGTYLPGNRLDPSMEELTFDSLVYDLALQLRKKDFYPEPVLGESDLLIVVHYGSTGYPDDFKYYEGTDYWTDQRFQRFDELGGFARSHNLDHLHSSQLYRVRDNSYKAKLLGMDFNRTWGSDKRLLSTLSSEPRYFVLLYAYDFPALKQGDIKLQWRTRYSIRSIGQSFTEGISHMNRIASDFMGENMKGFTQKRADDSSFVSYGEIEVIDVEVIKTEDRRTGILIQDSSHLPPQILQPSFEK